MIVKVSTTYKGVNLEVSANIDGENSKGRKALVQQLEWCRQDVDNIMNIGDVVSSDSLPVYDDEEEDEGHQEYLLITEDQKKYLRKLGLSDAKIAKIKTKAEASATITKLQKGK